MDQLLEVVGKRPAIRQEDDVFDLGLDVDELVVGPFKRGIDVGLASGKGSY